MRLYFDNNVYNRPFDDQGIPRNRDEAQAVEVLLEKVETGEVVLVSSFMVEQEHNLLPSSARRAQVGALIHGSAEEYVGQTPTVMQRARVLESAGLPRQDALHLAAAEQAQVDYFVTCDDKLLKRARRIGVRVEVVLPPEMFEEGVL